MKKSILAVAVVLGAATTFAQDLTSRKGENYLPEEGDWAIGIDAVPLLNYFGNFFGKVNDNNNAGNIWTPNNPAFAINGKYFLTEGMAIRGGIRIGIGAQKETQFVEDRAAAAPQWPAAGAVVENSMRNGSTNIGLTAGVEWRKGNTRLQGYYGAEFGFMVTSNKTKYAYGNALTAQNVANPVDVTFDDDFGGNVFNSVDGAGQAITVRELSTSSGVGFSLGLRGFIGAEYFIIPKLSIGGELGWGLVLGISGKGKAEYETVGATAAQGAGNGTVTTYEIEGTTKNSMIGVDNSLVNPLFGPVGRLNLTFHF